MDENFTSVYKRNVEIRILSFIHSEKIALFKFLHVLNFHYNALKKSLTFFINYYAVKTVLHAMYNVLFITFIEL